MLKNSQLTAFCAVCLTIGHWNVHLMVDCNPYLCSCLSSKSSGKNWVLGSLLLHMGRKTLSLIWSLILLWIVFVQWEWHHHPFWWEMMWRLYLCSNSHTVVGLSLALLCVLGANHCSCLHCKIWFNQSYQTSNMMIALIFCSLMLYAMVTWYVVSGYVKRGLKANLDR